MSSYENVIQRLNNELKKHHTDIAQCWDDSENYSSVTVVDNGALYKSVTKQFNKVISSIDEYKQSQDNLIFEEAKRLENVELIGNNLKKKILANEQLIKEASMDLEHSKLELEVLKRLFGEIRIKHKSPTRGYLINENQFRAFTYSADTNNEDIREDLWVKLHEMAKNQ